VGCNNPTPGPSEPPEPGPYQYTSAEYKLPASIDNDVLENVETEEWAKLYRPTNAGSEPAPLIIF
jgi:hypothetical protein